MFSCLPALRLVSGSRTEQGKACVVGDTVGDPFKDTSGPSLNILIKLMSMVSLTLSPMVEGNQDWDSWQWGLIPVTRDCLRTPLGSTLVGRIRKRARS